MDKIKYNLKENPELGEPIGKDDKSNNSIGTTDFDISFVF